MPSVTGIRLKHFADRLASTTLAYESKVSEVLTTEDGSHLDLDCVRSYTDEADGKAAFMIGKIMDELSVSGCGDIVTGATYGQTFSAIENQVEKKMQFRYQYLYSFSNCQHPYSEKTDKW